MATPQHSDDEREHGSPAPPPPPPPPPPQDDAQEDAVPSATSSSTSSAKPPPKPTASHSGDRPRRVDYRELLALFHADEEDPTESRATWDHLHEIALAEAREEFRVQQLERKKQKKRGSGTHTLDSGGDAASTGPAAGLRLPPPGASGVSGSSSSSTSSADKRPRPPAPGDADPNKAVRLNRQVPPPVANSNRPKGGPSKLLQKLGSRGN